MPAASDLMWTDDMVQELLDLSAEGLTRSQIGDRMGTSKGSICGKVRRLQARGFTVASNPPSAPLYDQPKPLATLRRHHTRITPRPPPPPPPAPAKTLQPLASLVAETRVPTALPVRVLGGCQWLNATRPLSFCDKPCVLNQRGLPSAYCGHHHARCFIRVRDRREDTAA